ncbi:ATP-binding protein [Nannocystaceae bacterium ST9]
MRRLLYRLFLINFTTFLLTLLAVVSARLLIDSDTTPLGRAQQAVSLSADLEQPPEIIARRLAMMQAEFGGRTSAYTLDGRLIASNVEPALPFAVEHNGPALARFPTRDAEGNQTGWLVFGPLPGLVAGEVGRTMLLALVIAGVVGLALAFVVTRRLVEPLTRLTEATRSVGRGQFDVQVELDRRDEVGELGRAFDEMTRKLALLQQSQRELLAGVSHEFRTPLARMRVVHAMLAEGEGDEVRELLPELATDLDELDRLVEGVLGAAKLDLDLSRGSPAALGPRESITGRELTDRVAARFRLAHPERELIVEIGDELGTIDADVPALLRACDNLLDNGLRHGPADRPLRLAATREADRLALAFGDEGPGIPAELREQVFAPFFRVERSRNRETGGLGLGLTIVARIVEAHAGRVDVDSRAGGGAVVTIRLPCRG